MTKSHLHPRPSLNLDDHPVPSGREEIWRFTPMVVVAPLLDATATWLDAPVVVNGGDGVEVSCLPSPTGGLVPVDRPSAIAANKVGRVTRVALSGHVTEPVIVGVDLAGGPYVGHVVIDAEPGSRAVVVIEHTGQANYIGNVEIAVGEGADLTVVSLQEWADGTVHAGMHQGLVGRDAHFRHVVVTLGGALVRLQTNVAYSGTGGSAELFGLYMTDGGQHQEHRLFVDQNMPKTVSRVDYRGALQGKGAHSVWVGDVLIRRDAEGTDSYESNRNLLLTGGCVADSIPNLEIETGNIVGAGHSSATGHFDDEQLFYLQSRGIPEDEARRLIVQGFFYDIIRRIGVPGVETRLRAAIDAELDAVGVTNLSEEN